MSAYTTPRLLTSRVEDETSQSAPAKCKSKATEGGSTKPYSLRLLEKRVVDAVCEDYRNQRIV
jgi:hypothetical protein